MLGWIWRRLWCLYEGHIEERGLEGTIWCARCDKYIRREEWNDGSVYRGTEKQGQG